MLHIASCFLPVVHVDLDGFYGIWILAMLAELCFIPLIQHKISQQILILIQVANMNT